MTEYIVSAARAPQLANPRDGGTFTAVAICLSCQACDIHPMRAPNPNPPRVTRKGTGDTEEIRLSGGTLIRTITDHDEHDRWDERPYDVVRICSQCDREWGQL